MVAKAELVYIGTVERPNRAGFRCGDRRQRNVFAKRGCSAVTGIHVSVDNLPNQLVRSQVLLLGQALNLSSTVSAISSVIDITPISSRITSAQSTPWIALPTRSNRPARNPEPW